MHRSMLFKATLAWGSVTGIGTNIVFLNHGGKKKEDTALKLCTCVTGM